VFVCVTESEGDCERERVELGGKNLDGLTFERERDIVRERAHTRVIEREYVYIYIDMHACIRTYIYSMNKCICVCIPAWTQT